MWVVYFDDKASYWLLGDGQYTIGRHSADIAVEGDPSISRTHVTVVTSMEVSAEAESARHVVNLIDSSRYGSSVCVSAADDRMTKLTPKLPWTPPADATSFTLCLGHHHTHFVFRCVRTAAVVCGVASENSTKLRTALQRCGVAVASRVAEADALAADALGPTTEVMAALCAAKPILDPSLWLEYVSRRQGPSIPPPEISVATATRYLPTHFDAFWSSRFGAKREAFLPNVTRTALYRQLVFVTTQKALFDEVSLYIPLGGGRVVLDAHVTTSTAAVFATRHEGRLLLFAEADTNDPIGDVLEALRRRGMATVSYDALLHSIIHAAPLYTEEPPTPTLSHPAKKELQQDSGGPEIAEVLEGGLILPPYPCFLPYSKLSKRANPSAASSPRHSPRLHTRRADAASDLVDRHESGLFDHLSATTERSFAHVNGVGQKQFKKQSMPTCGDGLVEMESIAASRKLFEDTVAIPPVDARDALDALMGPERAPVHSLDEALPHPTRAKASRTQARGKRPRAGTFDSAAVEEVAMAIPTHSADRTAEKKDALNTIFDIDLLY